MGAGQSQCTARGKGKKEEKKDGSSSRISDKLNVETGMETSDRKGVTEQTGKLIGESGIVAWDIPA